MGSNNTSVVVSISIAILLMVLLLLLLTYNSKCSMNMNTQQYPRDMGMGFMEGFTNDNQDSQTYGIKSKKVSGGIGNYEASENMNNNEVYSSAQPLQSSEQVIEPFYDSKPPIDEIVRKAMNAKKDKPGVSEGFNNYAGANDPSAFSTNQNNSPGFQSCFPRDRLSAEDLLPKDAADSKWARLNPSGTGDIHDQNYLTAGYHIGVNTVGQSLRNANLQLRSEIPNPQTPVGPWMISTIEPDLRPNTLEIGSAPSY